MKQSTINLIIYTISICIPIAIIQLYLINDQLIAHLIIAMVIITIIYGIAFVYGLNHKKRAYILSLPIYILTFVIFFKIVQYQSVANNKTGEELIILIEKYKEDHKSYPYSLTQLEDKYISKTPKIWMGLISSNYIYYYDTRNNSFSLDEKYGRFGRVWQSSMGSWNHYGD
jgi:hypothetical protein